MYLSFPLTAEDVVCCPLIDEGVTGTGDAGSVAELVITVYSVTFRERSISGEMINEEELCLPNFNNEIGRCLEEGKAAIEHCLCDTTSLAIFRGSSKWRNSLEEIEHLAGPFDSTFA